MDEFPFTSGRKRMTTVHRVPDGTDLPELEPGGHAVFMKGAPDVVLRYCSRLLTDDGTAELTDERREQALDTNRALAKQALRVLAVAYRAADRAPDDDADADDVEHDLVFVGLAGMIDPARPEATEAVRTARDAGIRTVMVTGDYPETAGAIARENGILREGGRVVEGAELEELDDEELGRSVEETDAYARVSPEHKVRILEGLKAQGHVAAMTGDGVNDAPGAQARRHRRRDGYHRHRRLEADLRDGPHRRQLREYRRRGRRGPRHLLEHPEVRLLPHLVQYRGDSHHLYRDDRRARDPADAHHDPLA